MKRKGARLGQHFLTGAWAAKKLVESAQIKAEDTALEIGPGKGALTKELLKTGACVIAIEKDASLTDFLRDELPKERLTVVTADVRDVDPSKLGLKPRQYILAANIPYYITGEIIRQFLTTDTQPKTIALLIQKEVAERILARDKKESILSISVKAYGTPSIAAKVSRGNFSPPPSVDSAILVIKDISKDFFRTFDETAFFSIVRAGFSSKRKLLAGNLTKLYIRERIEDALAASGIPEKARAEDVSLEGWERLVQYLLA